MARGYAALVHHPVRDRENNAVTASITNIDVHDIARSARTYGLQGLFIVTPISKQQEIVQRIIDHWHHGAGKQRIPERSEAIARIALARDVAQAIASITEREHNAPLVIATSAQRHDVAPTWSFTEARQKLSTETRPYLLLFGTGHGLHDSLLSRADAILEPISPSPDYNHLSVRAAAAIVLDRLHPSK